MMEGMISKIIGGLGDSASKVMGGVATLKRITTVDKTQKENNIHDETVQMMKAYANEMGKENKNWWDSFIDGIVRLPRPIIAYIVITLFIVCLVSPEYAKKVATAFSGLPGYLYGILGTVIAFYFGGRILNNKYQANRPKMTAEQHTSLMGMVQTTEKKIIDSNNEVIEESKKEQDSMVEMLQDSDGDGLDDRGVKFTANREGYKDKMYKCPAGYWTIGNGINLEAQKIPRSVAKLWFTHILKDVIKKMEAKYAFINKLDTARFWVVIDMAFNLGVNNTKTLKKTLLAVNEQLNKRKPNFKKVAKVMKSGKWYRQVGIRSKKLVKRMETGKWS